MKCPDICTQEGGRQKEIEKKMTFSFTEMVVLGSYWFQTVLEGKSTTCLNIIKIKGCFEVFSTFIWLFFGVDICCLVFHFIIHESSRVKGSIIQVPTTHLENKQYTLTFFFFFLSFYQYPEHAHK